MFGWLVIAQASAHQGNPDAAAAIAGFAVLFFLALVIAVVFLLPTLVLVYLTYSCFRRIPARCRQMEPWQTWLLLIPLFNLVWNFFVYPNLARSYQSYFAEQNVPDVGDCGNQLGLAFSVCAVLSFIPGVAVAALILWIIAVVKAVGLRNRIPEFAA